jgi:hypothetical protein
MLRTPIGCPPGALALEWLPYGVSRAWHLIIPRGGVRSGGLHTPHFMVGLCRGKLRDERTWRRM